MPQGYDGYLIISMYFAVILIGISGAYNANIKKAAVVDHLNNDYYKQAV